MNMLPESSMWSTYTLVRVGGLPADILPLSPKSVESSFNDLLVVEQKLSKTTDQLIELLYNIIPSITDNTVRRQLLGIKRKVYSGKFISDDQAEVMYSYLADDDISIVFSTWRRCVDDIAEIQKRIDDLCEAHSQEVDSALNSALNNESFMSSLSLASPEFVSYVTSGKEKNKRKKSEALKQQRTLYNYVTRASLKTSPFARLTTVNLAGCTGKGRSVQTISLHLASGLLGLAGQDRRPHPKLVLYPSPQGVVPSAGHERLMLIPHNVHQDGVIYRDETVIGAEWAPEGYPEIFSLDTLSRKSLSTRMRRHLESGSLRIQVPWDRHVGSPVSVIAQTFPEGIYEIQATDIEKINNSIQKPENNNFNCRLEIMTELNNLAQKVYPDGELGERPSGLLYEDCETTDEIPDYMTMRYVQEDLKDLSDNMSPWVYRSHVYDLMVQRFVSIYGAGGVCKTPLSFCMSLAVDGDGDFELLQAQQQDYQISAEKAFERSKLPGGATASPRHLGILLQFVASNPKDINSPNHMTVVNGTGNGIGAYLARVQRLFGEDFKKQAAQDITQQWETHRVFEMTVWADCNTGQAVSSGLLPELQLPGEPISAQGVPLEDLTLRHDIDTNTLELCDIDGPVGLAYLGITPQHILNSYYRWVALLADPWVRFPPLSDAAATLKAGRQKFSDYQVIHEPRETAGKRLVTRRASWYMTVNTISKLGCLDSTNTMRSWYDLRKKYGIPRLAYVQQLGSSGGTTDVIQKPLFVDFTSNISLMVLTQWISPRTKAIRITEALPSPDQYPYRDSAGQPRVSELAVAVHWPKEML
ncbi:hypothetical protein [Rothia sp. HMSC036D11]|uniref:hypothetical protein n=1 Tax=Rothia sp. HMSC036D11 TaxID=1739462 RepID=UPI000A4D229B|nr:hypothetical protein [Rothia sp. HMSC036D11]